MHSMVIFILTVNFNLNKIVEYIFKDIYYYAINEVDTLLLVNQKGKDN